MSDSIKHECGVAMLRLLKPLEYYLKKYGTAFYGINKMYLLMQKQHNRGQDGAGLASININSKPGQRYISRYRSNSAKPIQDVFEHVNARFLELKENNPKKLNDIAWLKQNKAFIGELYLGHLRYGTYGGNSIENCHPFLRQSNWRTRNLVLAGNFNMTNSDELFNHLLELGQHPKEKSDTVTILEKIGHFLDEENDRIYYDYKGKIPKQKISTKISDEMDLQQVLLNSSKHWDGGYLMCGIVGHGDMFALRDPAAIRPGFYYHDDEVVVITSERPVIQTAFNVSCEKIKEIERGHALIVKKDGTIEQKAVVKQLQRKSCSFERIYFSRGNDKDIYFERKSLGRKLCPIVLSKLNYDIKNTVFSFIPNTAEVSFYGMIEGIENYLIKESLKQINNPKKKLDEIIFLKPRVEKIAIKDAKLRTFITQDESRDDLVAHIYDVTYGIVKTEDTLVMIDDSIVRGTTLRQSILRILDRLGPKKIIIVSSAPQIRYPDCYGIDMAKMGDFIAFQAAISLHKENNNDHLITSVYNKCKAQLLLPKNKMINCVKEIYKPFTADQISKKISELLTPKNINAKIEIIYQSIEDLHDSCPHHNGDWYFTGDYPTPGGNKVVNQSFVNYIEGNNSRAY